MVGGVAGHNAGAPLRFAPEETAETRSGVVFGSECNENDTRPLSVYSLVSPRDRRLPAEEPFSFNDCRPCYFLEQCVSIRTSRTTSVGKGGTLIS
jgi:hypothetical protein